MNGDAVHQVFNLLFGFNTFLGWAGRIYLAIYILVFVCSVLNIFILIMEDGFFSLKKNADLQKSNGEMETSASISEEIEGVEYLAKQLLEQTFLVAKNVPKKKQKADILEGRIRDFIKSFPKEKNLDLIFLLGSM